MVAALVLAALVSTLVPGSAQAADGPASRWIVVLKNTVTDPGAVATEQTRPLNAPVREVLNLAAGTESLKGYVVEATPEEVAAIRTDPRVDFVEPDSTVRAPEPAPPSARLQPPAPSRRPGGGGAPCTPQADDPFFVEGLQWGLTKIQAPLVCARVNSAVAVLDTGVETTHEDLAGAVAGSVNFSDSPTAQDFNGHGTHVAGIAAAVTNNVIGVASVALGTRLWNVKVLNDDLTGSVENIARGLFWVARNAKANNIQVANMSLTTPVNSQVLRRAVRAATRARVTLVAAAGNLGTTQVLYPAGYPEVISVAATDLIDGLADFSTRGRWVDVAAPGVQIVSTMIDNDYAELSGTSMSAGFVSGAAAACLASHRCQPKPGKVEAQIGADADPIPGTGTFFRYGRLNAGCYTTQSSTSQCAPAGRGKVVSKKPLRVRKAPTTRSAAVGSLHPGQTIVIECKARGQKVRGNSWWYKLGQSPRGWAAARYVKNLNTIPACATNRAPQ